MGGQPNGSSAPFPRLRWVNRRGRCVSSQVSHFTLGTFSVNGLRTPPPWVTLRPFQLSVFLLLVFVLGYDV